MIYPKSLRRNSPFFAIIAFCLTTNISYSQVFVNGYYRRNGTYVQPHYRSSPDGSFYNNWSTKGNYNPYSGAYGTKVTSGETAVYFHDTAAQEELAAQRAHGEKMLQMELEHESAMFDATVKQKRIDEKNALGFLQRERARDAVQSSRINARIGPNPYYSQKQVSDGEVSGETSVIQKIPAKLLSETSVSKPRAPVILEFNGIRIFPTHQEFSAAYPGAVANRSNSPNRLVEYSISNANDEFDDIFYKFLDGRLLNFELIYSAEQADDLGGATELTNQIREKLGVPFRESQTEAMWLSRSSDRLIMASEDGQNWRLYVTRSSLLTEDQIESLIP